MKLVLEGGAEIFFSQKSDGDMLFKSESPEVNQTVRKNRQVLFEKSGILPGRLANLSGVHGNKIHIIKNGDLGYGALDEKTRISSVDGLIANTPNSYLMVTGADCFPVLFFEKTKGIAGALHVGWRGFVRGIIKNALQIIDTKFGGDPAQTFFWIGPGIRKCHFEIGTDVGNLLRNHYGQFVFEKSGKICADLPGAISFALTSLGAKNNHIHDYGDCTYCKSDKWFSYRRDKPKYVEASAFIISLS